VVYGEVTQ